MKTKILMAACAAFLFAGIANAQSGSAAKKAPMASKQAVSKQAATKDIVDTAVSAGSFQTLVAAAKAAGLVETLKGEGPYTVLAPTDDAFKKLPAGTIESLLKKENQDQLKGILTYHVIPGKVMAADVMDLKEAKTAQGSEVKVMVKDGSVYFNKSKVIKADVACSNGVIHVIDSVLIPKKGESTETSMKKDIVDTAVGAGSFTTLVAAVKAAGLVETLKGKGPFTVFAPTDEAFKKIPAETLQNLLKPENKEQLVEILTYHVVSGEVKAADVVKLKSAKTVNGAEVTIVTNDDGVMIDGANVVKTDIECGNGVIHVIDAVIMPK